MSSDEGDNADLHELPASIDAEDGIGWGSWHGALRRGAVGEERDG
jgi:hypothetical protein